MDVQGHLEPEWIEEVGQDLEDFWESFFRAHAEMVRRFSRN